MAKYNQSRSYAPALERKFHPVFQRRFACKLSRENRGLCRGILHSQEHRGNEKLADDLDI
jgi:hypothetical protein